MKAAVKATLAVFGLRIVRDRAMRPRLRRVLSGALKHQCVVPDVFGHTMHVDPNDAGLAIWTLSGQHVENCFDPEIRLLLRTIKSGDCVVDIGANVGLYTLLFARAAGPDGRVIAFEPGPRSIALLRQNLAINAICTRSPSKLRYQTRAARQNLSSARPAKATTASLP